MRCAKSSIAQEFMQILHKADCHNDDRTGDSRKEKYVEKAHKPNHEEHQRDCIVLRPGSLYESSIPLDGRLAAMVKIPRRPWLAGIVCAGLLMLPFPIAGPTPGWRTFFAWVAFVPLLWMMLSADNLARPSGILRATIGAYAMGVLWYIGNCYWIYQTMLYYGGLPPLVSLGILLLYSLILGLYFAAFGFFVTLIAKSARSPLAALLAAPFLWTSVELLSAHLTKVPWDLLGYSQVDNLLLTRLAPVTGVYGISFVLMAGNALIAGALLCMPPRRKWRSAAATLAIPLILQLGGEIKPPPSPVEAYAVLVQQNLDVNQNNAWTNAEYRRRVEQFLRLSEQTCGPYLTGMPDLNARIVTPDCRTSTTPPQLIAWPESPGPFHDKDARFLDALSTVARDTRAPIVAGNTGIDPHGSSADLYNSALFIDAGGKVLGRYDKVHLVPWGEYVPFKEFFSFAGNLTQQAGDMTHGWRRMVFHTGGHAFGVFICYEEIFGDEIRIFVRDGADVLVNLSDDGWYGDTCAPWQTLNMARMRAIENRRWLLRDTNTGLTTVVDPYGRMTASVPRHALTALSARFGYRSDLTFYTRYGDLFAMLCGIISLAALAVALRQAHRHATSSAA